MGAVGGGMWHFIRGMKASPSGYRLKGAIESVRTHSPRLGGSFANWGMTFAAVDCSLQYLRRKEDPWNSIGSGAITGFVLSLRFGVQNAVRSGIFGGAILALIEGMSIALTKMNSPPPPGVPYQPEMAAAGPHGPVPAGAGAMPGPSGAQGGLPPLPPGAEPASSSGGGGGWFSSLFGGSEPPKQQSLQTLEFKEEDFAPPPLPKEFGAGTPPEGDSGSSSRAPRR